MPRKWIHPNQSRSRCWSQLSVILIYLVMSLFSPCSAEEQQTEPTSTGNEEAVEADEASVGELPGDYFRLMVAKIESIQSTPDLPASPGAMLAASVLYAKRHPANPKFGDKEMFELACQIGDRVAIDSDQDLTEDRQDYEWEIHSWLDAYRLLEAELPSERRDRWRASIEKNLRWFVPRVRARIEFPRYQTPFIRTSTNHYAIWSSTVYLAGRVFKNDEWEALGARVMHRLATEEQTPDGYWGEFTDNGPTTGYNYLTMNCVALYWEHSRDAAALQALRRSTDFHKYFTWPDGTPVETINGRNRHWGVSAWGHFGFSHWPDGRGYAEFLSRFFTADDASYRDLGRLAQSALYYHEGPAAPTVQTLPRFVHQMQVPAGIRRSQPWTVCLSGLFDPPTTSQFTLDRQAALSIYHDRLGMIVIGANSKHQPELATFMEKADDRVTTVPQSSRLQMTDGGDRLGLAYRRFFAVVEVAPPEPDRLEFQFEVTEQGRDRMGEVQLNLQLVLKEGVLLETARTKIVLSEDRVELGPGEIGGWIRQGGWTLHVDPTSTLTWPVFGFNPYRNAPETELQYAVGVLTVPVRVQDPAEGPLNWRRQKIAFTLESR